MSKMVELKELTSDRPLDTATPFSRVVANGPPLVVGALLVVAFWPILTSMYGSWFDQYTSMEHGILVIPAAACMIWTRRNQLGQIPLRPSIWGLLLIFCGALQATFGVVAHWTWFSRFAFMISLVGCIGALYGFRMVRALSFPLITLMLMIAPPTFVYERLTLDLQLLASRLGEVSLEAMGYSVMREGNILELVGTKLSVQQACSGLRSLISIFFMCMLYDFFFVDGRLMRALILIVAIPMAIIGNVGRIVATGIASQYDRSLIQGTAHESFGYVSVISAGFGCILLHRLMVYIRREYRIRHV